jgi:hypothetical protein
MSAAGTRCPWPPRCLYGDPTPGQLDTARQRPRPGSRQDHDGPPAVKGASLDRGQVDQQLLGRRGDVRLAYALGPAQQDVTGIERHARS